MRGLLTRLGTRYGIALGLALLVVALVVATKLSSTGQSGADDASTGSSAAGASPTPTRSVDYADDSIAGTRSPGQPSVGPGTATPAAVATSFAQAWLLRKLPAPQWLAGLRPYSTPGLLAKLANTDPAGVPAERLTGEPSPGVASGSFVELRLPVDSGTLVLRLVTDAKRGTWLVDTIDWERRL